MSDNFSIKNVGGALRPHGLKGGAVFRPERDCSEEFLKKRFKKGSVLYLSLLERSKEKKKVVLEKITFGKKIIVYFQECSDRNAIEKLLPFELGIEVGDEQIVDLKGFMVYSQESGEKVGTVVFVGSNGVQKILEIRGKENFDIPWVPQFVEKIDKVEKKVFVYLPKYEEA